MPMPAARLGDMHMCPMVAPPGIPHVGGPIVSPGAPTVLISEMPGANIGIISMCAMGPDKPILGSFKVFLGGQPALRLMDSYQHGGMQVAGAPVVLLG